MTIKLHALDRWRRLPQGEAVEFHKADNTPRRVRLHVNCEGVTTFFVDRKPDAVEGEADMLCTVPPGLSVIEFTAPGKFAVFAEEGAGHVYVQTAEEEPTSAAAVDDRIFTKLLQRRQRNPELEQMMFVMEQNLLRREQALKSEFAAAIAAAKPKEPAVVDPEPAAPVTAPAPAPTGSEPKADEVVTPVEPGPDAGGANGGQ